MKIILQNSKIIFRAKGAPTDYIVLSGVGKAIEFAEGEYYISTGPEPGVYRVVGGAGVIQTLPEGTKLKLNDVFFSYTQELPIVRPDYGLSEITMKSGIYKYVDNTTDLALTTNDVWVCLKTRLKKGQTIALCCKGGETAKPLVKRTDAGVNTIIYSTPDFNTQGCYLQFYTATEDCWVYLNSVTSINPWVAMVK